MDRTIVQNGADIFHRFMDAYAQAVSRRNPQVFARMLDHEVTYGDSLSAAGRESTLRMWREKDFQRRGAYMVRLECVNGPLHIGEDVYAASFNATIGGPRNSYYLTLLGQIGAEGTVMHFSDSWQLIPNPNDRVSQASGHRTGAVL